MALGHLFSQRFGYATHALAYLAHKPVGELTTIAELSDWIRSLWAEASATYLANVIQQLARGGVLRSQRGATGGYALVRLPEQITLREVAEILEGVSQKRCALSLGPTCLAADSCNIQGILQGIEDDYFRSLEKISVADLAAGLACKFPATVSVLNSPDPVGKKVEGCPW